MSQSNSAAMRKHGLLSALLKSNGGSTLAIMAAALVPMTILTGSAVDVARVYVVQTRLQQACDAGVLAGRRFMTDTASSTLDATATQRANDFFRNNFRDGWMSTQPASFTPTKISANQVRGTASVVVPFTIMKMFGMQSQTVTASCTARFDVADTDIMFVLDTTGSMACAPNDSDSTCDSYVGSTTAVQYSRPSGGDGVPGYAGSDGYAVPEKSNSRIEALRVAVLNFYDTFDANKDPSTHVRYGFVTYTSSVNSGQAIRAISPSYLVGGAGNASNTWDYQSRYVIGDYTIKTISTTTVNNVSSSTCNSYEGRSPAATAQQPYTYDPSTGTALTVTTNYNSYYNQCTVTTRKVGPKWRYEQTAWDVSQLVAGNSITDPTKVDGSTTNWLGCIEEADTTASSSFSQSSLPNDLNPDLVPSSLATSWKPLLPDLIYMRNNYSSTNSATSNGDSNSHPNMGNPVYLKAGYSTCGKPVARLSVMSRDDVYNYVYARDFRGIGGTYHDTGMIWGTRLLSPTGIFSNDTAQWPGSTNAPNRVIVFLTDGYMAPSRYIYGQYGVEYYDRRVSNGNFGSLTDYHNARFTAECDAAKARNIDVWTVTIGPTIPPELSNCASKPTQALNTTSGSDLSDKFAAIAQHLAMLRLTQ